MTRWPGRTGGADTGLGLRARTDEGGCPGGEGDFGGGGGGFAVWVRGRARMGFEDARASSLSPSVLASEFASASCRARASTAYGRGDSGGLSRRGTSMPEVRTLHRGDGMLLHLIDLVARHGDTEARHVLVHGCLADVVPPAAQRAEFEAAPDRRVEKCTTLAWK
ncbi:hypothetical protein B0H14DRAFT_1062214 [Mycena olivaceomarginata]|nr:hypothetical protein B0H14DRAFT_1062214 [Mycena olivaceomarginata]